MSSQLDNRPTLPERPKAVTMTVEELVEDALAGRLRVPRLQTGLRWGAQDVLALFDSILRGFPIGSLLLWEKQAPVETLHFGAGVDVHADAVPNARFIVDGQQRITALVGALARTDSGVRDIHAIWYDLANASFERPLRKSDIGSDWIPLNVVGNRHTLLRWSREERRESLVDQAFELSARLMKYTMPAYVVRDATEDALRLIFTRVNSAGVGLEAKDVFQALFGTGEKPKPLATLAADIDSDTRFGALSGQWLLRCVKAVGEIPEKTDFSELDSLPDGLLEQTRGALTCAIRCIQTNTPFFHAKLLPYRLPLIVLSRFYHLHPRPHVRNETLLARWIWRGALSGEHGKSSQGSVASLLGEIGEDESGSVQRLLGRVPKELDLPAPTEHWRANAKVTRIYAATMLANQPLGLDDERPRHTETVAELLDREGLSGLFDAVVDSPEIAARGFQVGSASLADLPEEVLYSHGFEPEAVRLLDQGRVRDFLDHRCAWLHTHLGHLVRRQGEDQGDRDRPPIADVLAAAGAA